MAQKAAARPYKYATELAGFQGCPAVHKAAGGEVYRLCFNPISAKDFEPQAEKAKNDPHYEPHCTGWGLSLYVTEDKAKKRYLHLVGKYPHLKKTLGDHIAKATLSPQHGDFDKKDKRGHFNLYQLANVNLLPLFTIVSAIPPPPSDDDDNVA